jgi:hypothetical protein
MSEAAEVKKQESTEEDSRLEFNSIACIALVKLQKIILL